MLPLTSRSVKILGISSLLTVVLLLGVLATTGEPQPGAGGCGEEEQGEPARGGLPEAEASGREAVPATGQSASAAGERAEAGSTGAAPPASGPPGSPGVTRPHRASPAIPSPRPGGPGTGSSEAGAPAPTPAHAGGATLPPGAAAEPGAAPATVLHAGEAPLPPSPSPASPPPSPPVPEAAGTAAAAPSLPPDPPGPIMVTPFLPRLPAGIDPSRAKVEQGRFQQRLPDGTTVVLNLDPVLQARAEKTLKRHSMLHGGVVALEPATGRILAWAGRSTQGKPGWKVPGDASPLAASTFKMITAAALLETTNVNETTTVCYHGGYHRLSQADILGNPKRDHVCSPFRDALALSANAVFARLTYQKLNHKTLSSYAEAFGYNSVLAGFPLPLEQSRADLPSDDNRLELARSGAGFFHVKQSPLHAATIIAAIANGGIRMRPQLVERVLSPNGELLHLAQPEQLGRAIQEDTAARLGRMMMLTTTMGTGRQRFGQRWRHRQVKVSGKTGSLSQEQPTSIHYTWFVAFAPVDKPRLAVAALVGNGPLWHIKGLDLAREVMDAFFGPPSGTRPVASRPTLTGSGKSGSAPARAKTRTGKAGSPPASARSASTGAKSKAGAGKQPGSGKANAGGKTSR